MSSQAPAPAAPPSRRRRASAGAAGALAVIAIFLASVVGVVHAVVLSPDTLTSVVAPIGTNPQVQIVVADRAASGIVASLGIGTRAQNLIGGKLGAILGPTIAQAAQNRLATAIEGALASPAFQQRWEQIVHATAVVTVNVIRGDSAAITTSNGVIYLNLLPAIAATFDELKAQGLIDPSVQLPDLSNPSTPAQETIARISSALGISLPPDFGQVAIAQTSALEQAQGAVAAFDAVTVLLVIVALALTAGAVFLAGDRRAMVVGIGIGTALAVALVPPLLRFADHAVSTLITAPGMSVVAGAFTDAVVDAISVPLRVVAAVCLGVALAGMLMGDVRGAWRSPGALLPLGIGGVAAFMIWFVVGPDAALIALALVTAGAWITGRPLLVPAPAA